MKPHLQLYLGRTVTEIVKGGEAWQWAIKLDNGACIINKDRRETFVPQDVVGRRLTTISMTEADTTLVFSGGFKWSINPTQYAIHDPKHGGEVYPQWPEELEEAGIPSHPEEDVSTPPSADWPRQEEFLRREQGARIQSNAQNWLEEDAQDDGRED